MKVLMVGPSPAEKGGVSAVVNGYIDAGLDKKIELDYLTTYRDGNKIYKLIVALVAYIQLLVRVKEYDLVHVNMASRASFYRKKIYIDLCSFFHKKIVIHLHSGLFEQFYNKESNDKQREIIRKTFNKSQRVIVLSAEGETFVKSICTKPVILLNNAVIVPNNCKTEYLDHNVVFLGRITEEKGLNELLMAIPDVVEAIPDVQFYLAGEGDIEKYKSILSESKYLNHVHFLGWINRETKIDYLKKSSVFVLPSRYEGMPMSLLESMAYGLIPVVTRVGGIPLVINEENGYLVSSNASDELAEALIHALSDINREEKGKNAYRTVYSDYNLEQNLKRLIDIYQSIITSRN